MNFNDKDYALYKGDQVCIVGTIDEIAKYVGCERNYVHNLKSPSFHKRYKDNENFYLVYSIEGE